MTSSGRPVATPNADRAGRLRRAFVHHDPALDRGLNHQKEEEMRNVWRKTLVTAGIAVALAVGPGVGMANAAPLQLPALVPPPADLVPAPVDVLPLDLVTVVSETVLGLLPV
jgi:hypothetical protein